MIAGTPIPASPNDEARLRALVAALTTPDPAYPAPGATLRSMGPRVVPAIAEAYDRAGTWQDRAVLLVAAMYHARQSDAAIALGLRALGDRATVVRYRACGLLAYSLNPVALPALRRLYREGTDSETKANAVAAYEAIMTNSHHRFMDRSATGRTTWTVNDDDGPGPDHPPRAFLRRLRLALLVLWWEWRAR